MLKCSVSLWSANLANLGSDIKRIEPYADRFHFDVADGQYVKTLLFFPDLVKALRPYSTLPFEIHLITWKPDMWIEPFVDAGADIIIFGADTVDDPLPVIRAVKAAGKKVGVALLIDDPVDRLEPYLDQLDVITMMGTKMGIKGVSMDPTAPGKISQLRKLITQRGLRTEIEADGGIRQESVPLIHQAGADLIVPGSLMFNGDPDKLQKFLAEL